MSELSIAKKIESERIEEYEKIIGAVKGSNLSTEIKDTIIREYKGKILYSVYRIKMLDLGIDIF